MPHEFVPLAERIVDALLDHDPVLAADAGDHRGDDRLPDLSDDAVAAHVAMLRDAATALSEVDVEALGAADQVDHAILLAKAERELFELTEIREREWNPLVHNPGGALYRLIALPFAPAEQRLVPLTARLGAVPDALATARAVLRDCPAIHLETAIGQFTGVVALIRDEVPRLAGSVPGAGATLAPLCRDAIAELEGFVTWLSDRLAATGRHGGRDPRLGRRLWEARLWHTLDSELPAAELARRAEATIERLTAELAETAAALVGGPADRETARRALDLLAADHTTGSALVALARGEVAAARAFVAEHDLVSDVDDPCVVREMPEYARGVAVAYCEPPGPLETADVPTFYCIAPPPASWPAERVASFHREYNDHQIRTLTVHEAVPGHHLQLARARRLRAATRVRAVCRSGPFVEGWAVHSERLMADRGYGGLPYRLQQLKMQLRSCVNALLDRAVHCDGATEADATALLTGRGFQEPGEAAGKWRRAQLTSTQLSTYFAGYAEVSAIAAARPVGVTERAWHDAMLSHGSPPPRHLRTLLGV